MKLFLLHSNLLFLGIPLSFGSLWQIENYHVELEEMKSMSRQEYVAHLRRYTHRIMNNYVGKSYQLLCDNHDDRIFLCFAEKAVDFQGVLQYTEGSQGSCGFLEPHPPFYYFCLEKSS